MLSIFICSKFKSIELRQEVGYLEGKLEWDKNINVLE
jgi:hypothetical protein